MTARRREWAAWLALVAVATLLFETRTGLDIEISSLFFHNGAFPADTWWPVRAIYVGAPWAMGVLTLGALGVCLAALLSPRVPRWLWRRSAALLLCMLLGVGLAVHAGLKDHWGRARPSDVQAFGGAMTFTPPLRPTAQCDRNCSFVSGHAAGTFALMALGLFAAPQRRRRWLLAAVLAGTLMGAVRVVQGRHFTSDIVFCLIVIWGTCLLLREAWLRASLLWRRRQQRHAHAAG
jgi:membrane-associated PAP2 superfamily phosphatase